MNCQKLRKWVLLDETGELNAWQRARLARHLRVCADCRDFKRHAAALRQANPLITDRPAPQVMAEIQNAICAGVPARSGVIQLIWLRHPQMMRIAAIVAVLLAGAWLLVRGPAPHPSVSVEAADAAHDDSPALELLLTENVVEIRRIEELYGVATSLELELMLVEGLAI